MSSSAMSTSTTQSRMASCCLSTHDAISIYTMFRPDKSLHRRPNQWLAVYPYMVVLQGKQVVYVVRQVKRVRPRSRNGTIKVVILHCYSCFRRFPVRCKAVDVQGLTHLECEKERVEARHGLFTCHASCTARS